MPTIETPKRAANTMNIIDATFLNSEFIAAASAGMLLSFSLIVAIGAQNAYILKQGIRREHIFLVCSTCVLSDIFLILLSVSVFQAVADLAHWVEPALLTVGVALLLYMSFRSFYAALFSKDSLQPANGPSTTARQALRTTLLFTFVNPHTWLDTMMVIGPVSQQHSQHIAAFTLGCMFVSATFFYLLGYGASRLRPLFAKPQAWRVLEAVVGITMLVVALSLLPLW